MFGASNLQRQWTSRAVLNVGSKMARVAGRTWATTAPSLTGGWRVSGLAATFSHSNSTLWVRRPICPPRGCRPQFWGRATPRAQSVSATTSTATTARTTCIRTCRSWVWSSCSSRRQMPRRQTSSDLTTTSLCSQTRRWSSAPTTTPTGSRGRQWCRSALCSGSTASSSAPFRHSTPAPETSHRNSDHKYGSITSSQSGNPSLHTTHLWLSLLLYLKYVLYCECRCGRQVFAEKTLDCTFENESIPLCGFVNERLPQLEWIRLRGADLANIDQYGALLGPQVDHTLKSPKGAFADQLSHEFSKL